ncbi:MAG: phosphodiester glycosidase family protein [Actinomycetota bacterium]
MRTPQRLLLVCLTFGVLAAGLSGGTAGAASTVVLVGPVTISPGVEFTRYDVVQSDGTKAKVHVLEIDPSTSATIDVGYSKPKLPGKDYLSSWGPAQGAVAAINGDYSTNDRPDHLYVQDGALWQTGPRKGSAFGMRQDESAAYAIDPKIRVSMETETHTSVIKRWNSGAPAKSEIAGYSPEGGSIEDPPGRACSARLAPVAGSFRWARARKGTLTNYTVQARRCRADPLPEKNKVVITSRRGPASLQAVIKALDKGETVTIRTAYGMPGTVDAIGGQPVLLREGTIPTFTSCTNNSTLYCKHNRTAVGFNQACAERTPGCRVYYVVVDSRLNGWSSGMNPSQLAQFFRDDLGAWGAVNLDGGGSSEMWVQANASYPAETCQFKSTATGCFVNRPVWTNQTPQERPVENGLLVKAGDDLYPTIEAVPLPP